MRDSTLDGIARAKKYANVRFRPVDVESQKEIGYSAIADDRETLEGNLNGSRLKRKRLYR